MGLDSVLSDLTNDVVAISSQESKIDTKVLNNTEDDVPTSIPKISTESINEVTRKYNLFILYNNIKDKERLDKSLAIEAFSLIPNLSNYDGNRLTSNPSITNREIVDRVIKTDLSKCIDIEVIQTAYRIKDYVTQTTELGTHIVSYFTTVSDSIKNKLHALKDNHALILDSNGNRYNLLDDKIIDILRIDDTDIYYDKYSKKLISKYSDIYYNINDIMSYVRYDVNLTNVTLKDLANFINTQSVVIPNMIKTLTEYCNQLNEIDCHRVIMDSFTYSRLTEYNDIASKIERINSLYKVISVKDNVVDKIAQLVLFID